MDRYGHGNGPRGWLERAGETVQGWFGGSHDYDRDFNRNRGGFAGGYGGGFQGGGRVVERITPDHDGDRVRFVNRYDRDFGGRGYTGGGFGGQTHGNHGYAPGGPGSQNFNAGYLRGNAYDRDFGGYERDFGGRGTTPSGYVTGRGGMGRGGYGADYDRGFRGGMQGGGYGNRGYGAYDYNRGGQDSVGDIGGSLGHSVLDDRFGPYGMNRFRSASGGAPRPGAYFTGYGHGGPYSYMP